MAIPTKLTLSGKQTWQEAGLLNGKKANMFHLDLEKVGWQPGMTDARGQTLSGALMWTCLMELRWQKSPQPMTQWLRQTRDCLAKEADLLTKEERWWAYVFRDTIFGRYVDWRPAHQKACAHLNMALKERFASKDPVTLEGILENASRLLPFDQWENCKPVAKIRDDIMVRCYMDFPTDQVEQAEVVSMLAHPGAKCLLKIQPTDRWDWGRWVGQDPERWKDLMGQERLWEAMSNTGVGLGPDRYDRSMLASLSKALVMPADQVQELEKLLPSDQFLPRLKATCQQVHWGTTWEPSPQVTRSPRF